MLNLVRDLVSHTGVEAVGVFNGRTEGGFDPAPVAPVAGVVGEPDAVNGADDIVIDIGVHLMGPEEGADAACILVQSPVVGDSELERIFCLWMNLDDILEGLFYSLAF
jgi:hypothetical protein